MLHRHALRHSPLKVPAPPPEEEDDECWIVESVNVTGTAPLKAWMQRSTGPKDQPRAIADVFLAQEHGVAAVRTRPAASLRDSAQPAHSKRSEHEREHVVIECVDERERVVA